jgi:DHA3 family tetracycline resistance protein-like MFS transporter
MQPIVWFGIINVIGALLSLVSTEIIRRRLDLTRDRVITRTLTLLYIVKIAAVVGFSLAGNFALALTALWTVSLLSPIGALFMTWQNRHIESNVRATVISMSAQTDALGQIAGGPIIGATGTLFSLQAAIALSGLILSPAVALFIRASRTATSGHQS